MAIPHRRYLLILSLVFAVWWALLAIRPWDRHTWLIENALSVAAAALIVGCHRRLLLSRVSYTLIFVFMCLHQVGAHFSYAEVPYDAWFESLTGRSFNSLVGWERNNFDRVVHFSYGLPLDLTMSTSMLFELIEWGAAEVFGGDLGQAYLGTQGDVWDAHKDMALASLGALVAMLVTYAINRRFQRDFNREWAESLRVKGKRPLGEDELARLVRDDR